MCQGGKNQVSSFLGSSEDSGAGSVRGVVRLAELTVLSECCGSLVSALRC